MNQNEKFQVEKVLYLQTVSEKQTIPGYVWVKERTKYRVFKNNNDKNAHSKIAQGKNPSATKPDR